MIALRDDQITNAARLCCGHRHAWEQRSQSVVIFWTSSVVRTKQATIHEYFLAAVDLGRCSGDYMPRKKITAL